MTVQQMRHNNPMKKHSRDIYEYEYHNTRHHNPVKKPWRDTYEYLCLCVVMTCNI